MNPLDSSAERLEAGGLIAHCKSNQPSKRSTVPFSLNAWLRANGNTFAITFDRYNADANFSFPLQARLAA
jgi:hypothetical protein